jgi:hypothetical protein
MTMIMAVIAIPTIAPVTAEDEASLDRIEGFLKKYEIHTDNILTKGEPEIHYPFITWDFQLEKFSIISQK